MGIAEEKQKFVKNGITFQSVVLVPITVSGKIFNGRTAIKTKMAEVVSSTPEGDLHFKVIMYKT